MKIENERFELTNEAYSDPDSDFAPEPFMISSKQHPSWYCCFNVEVYGKRAIVFPGGEMADGDSATLSLVKENDEQWFLEGLKQLDEEMGEVEELVF